jgi:glyoxylase-like metal-dependent hydrolase (beta-lactamase superfamily II)
MAAKEILPGLHQISLGNVNAFLIRDGDELTAIDAGHPGDAEAILTAVRELGLQPCNVRNILITHAHYDHSGGLAALKEATGASAWMHPLDAALVRDGRAERPHQVAPGVLNRMLFWVFVRGNPDTIPPAGIEHEIEDGREIPVAGGLRAIHVPGHCAGQLAFLWPRHGGVVFAADAAANAMGLRLSITYEDLEQGRKSLERLSQHEFEVAVFGHGSPLDGGAARLFRRKFALANASGPERQVP